MATLKQVQKSRKSHKPCKLRIKVITQNKVRVFYETLDGLEDTVIKGALPPGRQTLPVNMPTTPQKANTSSTGCISYISHPVTQSSSPCSRNIFFPEMCFQIFSIYQKTVETKFKPTSSPHTITIVSSVSMDTSSAQFPLFLPLLKPHAK